MMSQLRHFLINAPVTISGFPRDLESHRSTEPESIGRVHNAMAHQLSSRLALFGITEGYACIL